MVLAIDLDPAEATVRACETSQVVGVARAAYPGVPLQVDGAADAQGEGVCAMVPST